MALLLIGQVLGASPRSGVTIPRLQRAGATKTKEVSLGLSRLDHFGVAPHITQAVSVAQPSE